MYDHPLINFDRPAKFWKKSTSVSVPAVYKPWSEWWEFLKNSTFQVKSWHNKMERTYSRPLHAIASCHCITKASGWSSNIFEARAVFICLLHGVHVAANKMSYGSHFIFLGCFQDVTTSDPIQVKDLLLKKWCIDMFGELKGTKSRIGRNMQDIEPCQTRKSEWTHCSIFLKMEKLGTRCKAPTCSR